MFKFLKKIARFIKKAVTFAGDVKEVIPPDVIRKAEDRLGLLDQESGGPDSSSPNSNHTSGGNSSGNSVGPAS